MVFLARVVQVLIASPGDARVYRDSVERALHEWNGSRAEAAGVVLLPRRWETNAVPLIGQGDAQSVINSQLVDTADIVFAFFFATLGRSTARAVSGTAEELERSQKAGKPVHVYFSTEPVPRDHDKEQLRALDEFKTRMERLGLYGTFSSESDLREQVRTAVEYDLGHLDLGTLTERVSGAEHARLRAEYRYEKEPYVAGTRTRYRTRRQQIVVVNSGAVVAERVRMTLAAIGDGELPILRNIDVMPDIAPGGSFPYPTITYGGLATAFNVRLIWNEGDEEHEFTHTLSLS